MLESHGASRMLASFHDILPHWVFTGLYFSDAYIQEHPDLVKATVAGLIKSFDFIRNQEEQARMHMPKYTGMDMETCMISALREYSSPYKSKDLLERQRDVMLQYGYLDKKLDIDHMIDYSFLTDFVKPTE